MAPAHLTRIATLSLGLLYVAAGVTEIARAATTSGGEGVFLPATLVAGGALVLAGLFLTSRRPHVGRGLVCVGSLLGILATVGTVVVPALAVAVVFLNLRETASA